MPGASEKNYSEATSEIIDREVKKLVDGGLQLARNILEENRGKVELMTNMLMEFETLDRQDIDNIMDGTWDSEKKQKRVDDAVKAHTKAPPPPPIPSDEPRPISTDGAPQSV